MLSPGHKSNPWHVGSAVSGLKSPFRRQSPLHQDLVLFSNSACLSADLSCQILLWFEQFWSAGSSKIEFLNGHSGLNFTPGPKVGATFSLIFQLPGLNLIASEILIASDTCNKKNLLNLYFRKNAIPIFRCCLFSKHCNCIQRIQVGPDDTFPNLSLYTHSFGFCLGSLRYESPILS